MHKLNERQVGTSLRTVNAKPIEFPAITYCFDLPPRFRLTNESDWLPLGDR